eukprot:4798238-Prymnesium_polylepis.1
MQSLPTALHLHSSNGAPSFQVTLAISSRAVLRYFREFCEWGFTRFAVVSHARFACDSRVVSRHMSSTLRPMVEE